MTGRTSVLTHTLGSHPGIPSTGRSVAGNASRFQFAGVPPAWTGLHAWAAPSAFGNVPNDAVTEQTIGGQLLFNRQLLEPDLKFGNWSFAVGTGGYDPADPTQATVPNPAAVALANKVFPAGAGVYEPIDRKERPNDNAISFLCRLETAEALFGLGEAGLFVQITESSIPAEIGTWVMVAIMHFPIQAKSSKTVQGYRFAFQH
jgi:hypothetical protein